MFRSGESQADGLSTERDTIPVHLGCRQDIDVGLGGTGDGGGSIGSYNCGATYRPPINDRGEAIQSGDAPSADNGNASGYVGVFPGDPDTSIPETKQVAPSTGRPGPLEGGTFSAPAPAAAAPASSDPAPFPGYSEVPFQ